jgi:hypothetical protein
MKKSNSSLRIRMHLRDLGLSLKINKICSLSKLILNPNKATCLPKGNHSLKASLKFDPMHQQQGTKTMMALK